MKSIKDLWDEFMVSETWSFIKYETKDKYCKICGPMFNPLFELFYKIKKRPILRCKNKRNHDCGLWLKKKMPEDICCLSCHHKVCKYRCYFIKNRKCKPKQSYSNGGN